MQFTVIYVILIAMMVVSLIGVTYVGIFGLKNEKAKISKAIRKEQEMEMLNREKKREELFSWYATQK